MDLLFTNVNILTMDPAQPLLRNAFLGIDGRTISYIGPNRPEESVERIIDGGGKAVMPGFFNTHTHLGMSCMRGYADEYELQTWLNQYIWPVEARMNPEIMRIANTISLAEAIAGGTVSFTDMYFFEPELAELCCQIGVMANLSNGATCFEDSFIPEETRAWRETEELRKHYHRRDGLIRADVSIHAEYTSFPQVWETMAAYAKEHDLNMHVHLSETRAEQEACLARYGLTPAAVLDKHGVFATRTTAAHCVYLTAADIELLAARDVTAAHDPGCNLKLASGIMNYPLMKERGMRISLATDSAAAINTHDMFFELKLAVIIHKGISSDPTMLSALEALEMATTAGAYAQRRENETGILKVDYDADLQMIDLDQPHLLPGHDPFSQIVYSAKSSDVWLTMCKGRVLYRDGEWLTLDIEKAKWEMEHKVMPELFGRDA